jgi:hypothetical protein
MRNSIPIFPGGVLESMGRLFKRSVKMYVYLTLDPQLGEVRTVDTASIPPPWHHMRALLREIGRIEPIRRFEESYLGIHTPEVQARIQRGDRSWESLVPAQVAAIINSKKLFAGR